MRGRRLFAVEIPFVHAPEMPGANLQVEVVHEARHQRELFRRPNRSTDAYRVVGRGLLPGGDVFERLSQIKLFERVVEHDLEAGPRQLEHLLGRQGSGVTDDGVVERGVIPPIGSYGTEFAWHRLGEFELALTGIILKASNALLQASLIGLVHQVILSQRLRQRVGLRRAETEMEMPPPAL